MSSNPTLTLRVCDTDQLAACVLDRFQQLWVWVPLPNSAPPPQLGDYYPLEIQLPADERPQPLRVCIQCYLQPPEQPWWIGVTLEDQAGHEQEQRIRYLTREHQAQYGKLLRQLFAR